MSTVFAGVAPSACEQCSKYEETLFGSCEDPSNEFWIYLNKYVQNLRTSINLDNKRVNFFLDLDYLIIYFLNLSIHLRERKALIKPHINYLQINSLLV